MLRRTSLEQCRITQSARTGHGSNHATAVTVGTTGSGKDQEKDS